MPPKKCPAPSGGREEREGLPRKRRKLEDGSAEEEPETMEFFLYGGRDPSPQDIDQSEDLNNCYMLAPLVFLATHKPDFITTNLLKIDGENGVIVTLYYWNRPIGGSRVYKYAEEPTDKQPKCNRISVSKKEIEDWGRSEKNANWVKAVEIAYAKHMKGKCKDLCKKELRDILKTPSEHSTEALTILTGENAEWNFGHFGTLRDRTLKRSQSNKDYIPQKFPENATYNTYCNNIYKKIKEACDTKKIVVAEFRHIGHNQFSRKKLSNVLKNNSSVEYRKFEVEFKKILGKFYDDTCDYMRKLKPPLSKDDFIDKVIRNELFRNSPPFKKIWKEKLNSWLSEHKDDPGIPKDCKKVFGLIDNHAYSVVGCFEDPKEGEIKYRYITLQNPYNKQTYIDYSTSKHQPRTLPISRAQPDGATAPNLFNMELAHFCKYLRYLNYTQ